VDNELEVIRHQMEEKRASLADKLEALESQVKETVQGATAEVSHIVDEVKSTVESVTSGVQETVESVKDTLTEGVQDTVASVKQSLNVNDHIRRNPWLAMGGAVAAGFAAGYFLRSSRSGNGSWDWHRREQGPAESAPAWTPPASRFTETPAAGPASSSSASESAFGPAVSALEEAGMAALRTVRELAVGTLMGVLGQVAANSLPPFLKDDVTKLTTDLTTKLGGKVLDLSHAFESQEGEAEKDNPHAGARSAFAANDRSAQRANGRDG
jgi:ElaB/YqjD/DUF883 family membrane-anchored ribosome-binding protein